MPVRSHSGQVLHRSDHVPYRSGQRAEALPGAARVPAHRKQHAPPEREDCVGEAAAGAPGGTHAHVPAAAAEAAQDLTGEAGREEVQQGSPRPDRVRDHALPELGEDGASRAAKLGGMCTGGGGREGTPPYVGH